MTIRQLQQIASTHCRALTGAAGGGAAPVTNRDILESPAAHGMVAIFKAVCDHAQASWWDIQALRQGPQPCALLDAFRAHGHPSAESFVRTLEQEVGFVRRRDGRLILDASTQQLLQEVEAHPALRVVLDHSIASCGADPGHDLSHFLRVAQTALRLAGGEDIPRSHMIAAALLHDIVNLPKGSPRAKQSSALSAERARDILTPLGLCSPTELDVLCHAITTHSYSAGHVPTSPLGRCLQDADRLDALGAIGAMRLFAVGAQPGSAWFDPQDPWAQRRPLDDKRYAFDHLTTKLYKLAPTMTTAAGRAEAVARTASLQRFIAALAQESGLPPSPEARAAPLSVPTTAGLLRPPR